jgi:hypothetical protein
MIVVVLTAAAAAVLCGAFLRWAVAPVLLAYQPGKAVQRIKGRRQR